SVGRCSSGRAIESAGWVVNGAGISSPRLRRLRGPARGKSVERNGTRQTTDGFRRGVPPTRRCESNATERLASVPGRAGARRPVCRDVSSQVAGVGGRVHRGAQICRGASTPVLEFGSG